MIVTMAKQYSVRGNRRHVPLGQQHLLFRKAAKFKMTSFVCVRVGFESRIVAVSERSCTYMHCQTSDSYDSKGQLTRSLNCSHNAVKSLANQAREQLSWLMGSIAVPQRYLQNFRRGRAGARPRLFVGDFGVVINVHLTRLLRVI